jgi:integrase
MTKTKRSKSTKPAKKIWPPIHELKYASSETRWQVRYQINGKRTSEVYNTKAEAETAATQVRLRVENEGAAGFSLPADVRAEASKAVETLKPYEATITEAVTYYVEHVLKFRNAPPVSELVKGIVAEAESSDRRKDTIRDLRYRLEKFARTFGKRQLAGISLAELKQWLDDPTQTARTRINYATKVSQLYGYAIRHGWTDTNLIERISRPTPEAGEPGIFTVEQAALLLEHAESVGLLPYVALGLFAGIRSAELQRLDWSAVKVSERAVIVGAGIAKKRSRRVVEITDSLAAWLALCGKPRGPVVDVPDFRKALNALAKAAGVEWPQNGLRHSFASYHLAAHGDPTRTAFQMGHTNPRIVADFYKALVTKADAERFWSLRPAADAAGKIVPMQSAANG